MFLKQSIFILCGSLLIIVTLFVVDRQQILKFNLKQGKTLQRRKLNINDTVSSVNENDDTAASIVKSSNDTAPLIDVSHHKPQLCILRSDNRPYVNSLKLSKQDNQSAIFTDYLTAQAYYLAYYAKKHNYKFYFYQFLGALTKFPTWVKIYGIQQAMLDLTECDYFVMLDGDAYPTDPKISFEFMLERWGFYKHNSSVLMALDPNIPNRNRFGGTLAANAGFIVIRKSRISMNIFGALSLCSDLIKGCKHWDYAFAHEQAAFAEFFKGPVFNDKRKDQEVIYAPCDEGNGYIKDIGGKNGKDKVACHGIYMSHPWAWKDEIASVIKNLIEEDEELREIHSKGVNITVLPLREKE